ncbi:putative Zn(II)2Cys6 transcription factor [Aspergillus mulundensis]|uniref:Putative Zn(II)2Cys6 transcription factor n=1 Tax=Aspergillus mulundensis TaxID=1810919 RepID=A0A3D8T3F0_9EURO|nr:putative Zn(II)2Cys6 transcription factor [Aspergillus mulundensis]RDW93049.1 putative Zn(II)2Cys6 transcription factor [Aspergillus mulundensis]
MPSDLKSTEYSQTAPTRKRRKIRKGTTSCWECKRRKVRCSLVDDPNGVCKACRRRGANCLTQDFADVDDGIELVDDVRHSSRIELADDIRISARVPELISPAGSTGASPSPRRRQGDVDLEYERGSTLTSLTDPIASISHELHASLPSRKDISSICKVLDHVPLMFHEFLTRPHSDSEEDASRSVWLLDIPPPESHPALLARYMLRLATPLQSLDLKKSGKQLSALLEAPQLMAKRLAETAIHLVTSRDELLGSVEGVECAMLEGNYEANRGNYCPAWIAFRKAMTLAQVLGVHRPRHSLRVLDSRRKVDSSFLWYRIVYVDRFMCLMMGRPQGSMDRSMGSDAVMDADTPLGQLERFHCFIASQILERNDAESCSADTTQNIDYQLRKAAEFMPSEWWMVPNAAEPEVVDREIRLVCQINHYGLINQLHIPYMLRFANAEQKLHTYSHTTCINASREILTRYVALGNSNGVAYTCRVIDFFTLSSALLILLAHLRQHTLTPGEFNNLAHQRQGDRGLVSKAIDNLQKIAWASQDRIIAKSADLLSRLLDMEAEASIGSASYSVHTIGSPEDVARETDNGPPPLNKGLRFCIPWFGFVRIVLASFRRTPSAAEIMAGEDIFQFRPEPDGQPVGENRAVAAAGGQYTQGQELTPPEQPWYADTGFGADDWTMQGFDMSFWNCFFQGPGLAMPMSMPMPVDGGATAGGLGRIPCSSEADKCGELGGRALALGGGFGASLWPQRLGHALAKSYLSRPNHTVIGTVRDTSSPSLSTLTTQTAPGSKLLLYPLESTNDTHYTDLSTSLATAGITHLNLVIANAGVAHPPGTPASVGIEDVRAVFDVNALGTLRLFQALRGLLERGAAQGREVKWVSVSSGAGSIEGCKVYGRGTEKVVPYGVSKAAVNWVTVAIHASETWLTAFAIHPGWVQTEMGNAGARVMGLKEAPNTVEEAITKTVATIDDATRESSGGRFVNVIDGTEIPW